MSRRVLDLNTVARPVLSLVLQDDDRTCIDISTPTEGLVEELRGILPQLNALVSNPDEMDARVPYDLAARLINCNKSGVRVTPEELPTKYRVNLESLIIFFGAYADFVNSIADEKN